MIDLGPTLSIPLEVGHYVYLHLDADGLVLYVGRTSNPAQRTANHIAHWRTKSHWWSRVRSIEWERYEAASDAVCREWQLIESLRTPHNFLPQALLTQSARLA